MIWSGSAVSFPSKRLHLDLVENAGLQEDAKARIFPLAVIKRFHGLFLKGRMVGSPAQLSFANAIPSYACPSAIGSVSSGSNHPENFLRGEGGIYSATRAQPCQVHGAHLTCPAGLTEWLLCHSGKSVVGKDTPQSFKLLFRSQPPILGCLVLAAETYRARQRISRVLAAKPRVCKVKNHHKTTEEVSYSIGVIFVTLLCRSREYLAERVEIAKGPVVFSCVSFHASRKHVHS